MRFIGRRSSAKAVLADAAASMRLIDAVPDIAEMPLFRSPIDFPLGPVLDLLVGSERSLEVLHQLADLADPSPRVAVETPIDPNPDLESSDVARASAKVTLPTGAVQNARFEIVLAGPNHGNPFIEVELIADFVCGDVRSTVGGFYDGNGDFVLRFLPPAPGEWFFTTSSTARSLDGISGVVSVSESEHRGPIRAADAFGFADSTGKPFVPVGTTAYVWTHQGDALEEQTLASLQAAPFTKIRMCIFPKHMEYNSNEPNSFVFPRSADGTWDTTRFDLDFFRHLERRLDQLNELGVEADLILFHPYDRWGFSSLGPTADERYLRYLVRRLASFANVWWSLANEYDLLLTKEKADWDRLAEVVREEDFADHLLSIHNWLEIWDYDSPWATHCSIQRGEPADDVTQWQNRWGKPVIVDESGYEGDLEQGWGNLTAADVVHNFWNVTVRGGYATHGETYYTDDEVIWWAKGGPLKGESIPRLEFLASIVAESPTGRIGRVPARWGEVAGGVPGEYILYYFGRSQPLFQQITVPDGMTAVIDVIDTWNMTVDERPGVHEGTVRVDLLGRPGTVLRLRAAER